MNKKGFTLVEVLASIAIIGVIMLVVVPLITKSSDENKETLYHNYENMVEEYAQIGNYQNQDFIPLGDIDELKKVNDECTGYVVSDKTNKDYKAYISCGDKYQTEGYNEEYTK